MDIRILGVPMVKVDKVRLGHDSSLFAWAVTGSMSLPRGHPGRGACAPLSAEGSELCAATIAVRRNELAVSQGPLVLLDVRLAQRVFSLLPDSAEVPPAKPALHTI